ncbi:enediyne biosynthesis protein E5 [Methylomarinovum tepidoasis]|uniref:Enediyne biosynthesis protein E5 n=1 Tax=Methylomarinovum tepidoasis TaxID=2840183 RepID=A0AAU9CV76_9GAMM|nr:RnfABCDGE type electron transport complex subunit D [Methylomarinovum sp. IN45]BCX88585.1 enediyne biosynthesis protein E5 [Methylomarinovum sp. IN45]
MNDPRHLQILILAGLLFYGLGWRDFPGPLWIYAVYPLTALTVQGLFCRALGLPFDFRSPLISSLSLGLLLHTQGVQWAVAAAAVAIAGKFLLRIDGRHVFNPANLGIVAAISLTDQAWVSPGQWGLGVFLALAAVLGGLMVLRRTRRSDATWAFLAAWVALVFGRALWLGDPPAIPWLQLQNVALLIFAFFMLSDPMTLPDRRAARIAFAVIVAVAGYVFQYHLYIDEGLFYALALAAPLVPLLNRRLPGARYLWPRNVPSRR